MLALRSTKSWTGLRFCRAQVPQLYTVHPAPLGPWRRVYRRRPAIPPPWFVDTGTPDTSRVADPTARSSSKPGTVYPRFPSHSLIFRWSVPEPPVHRLAMLELQLVADSSERANQAFPLVPPSRVPSMHSTHRDHSIRHQPGT